MLLAIGSLGALNSGGRLGVMVEARPLAEPAEGRQLVALQLRTVDQRDALGQAAARVSGLAPLPAEACERAAASRRTLASRQKRGPPRARRPHQRSATEPAAGEEWRSPDVGLHHEEVADAALARDLLEPLAEPDERGADGRGDAPRGLLGCQATTTIGAQPAGPNTTGAAPTPSDNPAQDEAAARLGLRLYAGVDAGAPRARRLDLTS